MARYDPRYEYNGGYAAGDALLGLAQLLRQGVGDYQRLDLDEEKRRQDERDYLLRLRTLMSAEADREARTEDRRALLADNRETRQVTYLKQLADLAKEQRHEGARADVFGLTGQPGPARTVPVERLPQDANDAEAPPAEMTVPGAPRSFLDALREVSRKRGFVPSFSESDLRVLGEGKDTDANKLQEVDPTKDLYRGGKLERRGTPKAEPPAKPFAEGKTSTELELYIADPATPPEQRKIAEAALANIRAADLEKAKQTGAIALANQRTMVEERDTAERGREADKSSAEMAQVKAILGKIEALVPKVNTPGVLGRLAGATTRRLEEFAQTNPDINQMAALGEGYISVIAKIVQRQSGVLSDQDLRRAEKSIPLITDSLEVAQRKLTDLKEIVATAEGNLARLRQPRGGMGTAAPAPATPAGPNGSDFLRRFGN